MHTVALRLDVHCSLWSLIDIIAITMATWILHLGCDNITVYRPYPRNHFCDYVIYLLTNGKSTRLCVQVYTQSCDEGREVAVLSIL